MLSNIANGVFRQFRDVRRCVPVGMSLIARRNMFIEAHPTPNNNSLKFHPSRPVYQKGTKDFPNVKSAAASPLAESLFKIDGVSSVFFGPDFVTVTKKHDEIPWSELKPKVLSAIMDFYSSGAPIVTAAAEAEEQTATAEEDCEVVTFIKELLDTRIRPSVQDDGGDITFVSFDEKAGVVTVRLQGACSSCSSSKVTLKQGVENMLMHYVPEVKEVVALEEDTEDPNDPLIRAQQKFEEEIEAQRAAGGGSAGAAEQQAAAVAGEKASSAAGPSAAEREERARKLLADVGI